LNGDGCISEAELIAAVAKADERIAERQNKRMQHSLFAHGHMLGEKRERAAVARINPMIASGMFKAVVRKKMRVAELQQTTNLHMDSITLVDFMALCHPHLPRSSVKRAIRHYDEKPSKPKKTLDEGAREEISMIFEHLDKDHDGLVRVKSLRPLLNKLGIQDGDLTSWLTDLKHKETNELCRAKSKLNEDDFSQLLEPVYMPQTPQVMSREEEQRKLDQALEFAADVMYGERTKLSS